MRTIQGNISNHQQRWYDSTGLAPTDINNSEYEEPEINSCSTYKKILVGYIQMNYSQAN